MVTTGAIYNLKLDGWFAGTYLRRRIEIKAVDSISVSKASNQVVIHVPTEYDYRISHRDHHLEFV